MAQNLKAYFEGKQALYQGLKNATGNELTKLADELGAILDEHGSVQGLLAEKSRAITEKREAMAAPDLMPSDIEDLAAELRTLLTEHRTLRVEMLETADQISLSQRRKEVAEERLKQYNNSLSLVADEVESAGERAERHAAWAARVTEGVVDRLQDQATALLNALPDDAIEAPDADPDVSLVFDAKARVEGDIPEILRDRARTRGQNITTLVQHRRSNMVSLGATLGSQQAARFGVMGELEQAWHSYASAEEGFIAVVAQGDTSYQQALGMLATVAASAELTTAEQERIAAVALAADADALVNEQARDAAQAAVAEKVIEIEDAIIAAWVDDIDADPEANATVQARRAELTPLEATLSAAEGDLDESMQEALALWQGAVPEGIWNNLVKFDRAIAILTAIRDADVANLQSAMEAAETDLVNALQAEDRATRLVAKLEEREDLLALRTKDLEETYPQHLTSALRGDEGYHSSLDQGEIA